MNGDRPTQGSFSSENTSSTNLDPANLAYLMGQIGRFDFQKSGKQYAKSPAKPQVKPQRKPHNFTASERLSFEFLKTWVADFSEGYTDSELKKAFRQAALALHPDHGGHAAQFIELKEHYAVLQKVAASL